MNIICFSGGKDSTALLLWARDNLEDFTTVFCDTGWEHPITYGYVQEINKKLLNNKLVILKSSKYQGFVNLCVERKGFPSVHRRFCTQELKVFPMHSFISSLQPDEINVYQGIRADESTKRSKFTEEEWINDAGGYYIQRPLLRWNAQQCFDLMKEKGIAPNPLYMMGSGRVGCFPCIMTGLRELKRIIKFHPELEQRLIDLEKYVNENVSNKSTRRWPATFWATGTIPARFCSLTGTNKEGKICAVPTAADVFAYIKLKDEAQLPLEEVKSCMSVYNLCE